MAGLARPPVAVVVRPLVTGHLTLVPLETHARFTFRADAGAVAPLAVLRTSPANVGIVVEVEAIAAVGPTRVGALVEVETAPARGALVATATDAGLAQRRALLAALPIVAEKAAGALRHTHPGVVLELEEEVEAVVAVMGSGPLAAVLIALRVTGAVVLLGGLLIGGACNDGDGLCAAQK